MMGQIELAKTALRKAADSANDFEGREEARRRLAWVEAGTPESAELSLGALEAMAKQQPNDVLVRAASVRRTKNKAHSTKQLQLLNRH